MLHLTMKRKRSKYDPDRSPDSAWWSSLDEEEQISLVLDHHRRAGARLPNAKLHAVTHVVVGGEQVVEHGKLTRADEVELARAAAAWRSPSV